MKIKNINIDRTTLLNEYLTLGIKGLSIKYHICRQTVRKLLQEYNIERIGRVYKRKDLTNMRFGNLTAIRYCHWSEFNTNKSKTMWLCKCDCGNERLVDSYDLTSKNIISCGCKNGEKLFNGVGNLSGTYYNAIRKGAEIRNLKFDVSKEYLWNLFLKQCGKCALTGDDIHLEKKYHKNHFSQTASLDRIDSSQGYIEGNVQWVSREVNFFKNNKNEKDLYNLCKKIYMKLGEKYENN